MRCRKMPNLVKLKNHPITFFFSSFSYGNPRPYICDRTSCKKMLTKYNEFLIKFQDDINTMLCPKIFKSNTIELTVHTSCYWVLDLLCVNLFHCKLFGHKCLMFNIFSIILMQLNFIIIEKILFIVNTWFLYYKRKFLALAEVI